MNGPFPDVSPASDDQRRVFKERSRGAVPFKFIPADEGGWYVSPAYCDDPVGRQLFGQVFLIRDEELPAFLLDSYSYFQTRIEASLARGEKLRAARVAVGGRKPTKLIGDPLATLDIELEL